MFNNKKMEKYYTVFVDWVTKENEGKNCDEELKFLQKNAKKLPISAILGISYKFNQYEAKLKDCKKKDGKSHLEDITNMLEQMMLCVSAYSEKHRSAHKYVVDGFIRRKIEGGVPLTDGEKLEIVKWIEQRKDLVKSFSEDLDEKFIEYIKETDEEIMNFVTPKRYNILFKQYKDKVL